MITFIESLPYARSSSKHLEILTLLILQHLCEFGTTVVPFYWWGSRDTTRSHGRAKNQPRQSGFSTMFLSTKPYWLHKGDDSRSYNTNDHRTVMTQESVLFTEVMRLHVYSFLQVIKRIYCHSYHSLLIISIGSINVAWMYTFIHTVEVLSFIQQICIEQLSWTNFGDREVIKKDLNLSLHEAHNTVNMAF